MRIIWNKLFMVLGLCFFFISSDALGVVRLTLQGSSNNSNLGLQNQSSRSLSTSIGMDLGTYFRVGLTHREAVSTQNGYSLSEGTEDQYVFSESIQNVSSNSVDLTIVLYYGQIFMPYIMAGGVLKTFAIESLDENGNRAISRGSLPLAPNAGVGIGLKLNRHFSLKLSHTVSPGVTQKDPSSEPVGALDAYTSVGVSYSL